MEPRATKRLYLLEERQLFSDSLLWSLQRTYFASRGVDAWRQDEVPHAISNSAILARTYAELVLAFFQDQSLLAPRSGAAGEALHICELGAGSGRFAYHFLCELSRLCGEAGIAPASFRYVLTDVAGKNLEAWRRHPRFQPFFANRMLDLAPFDVEQTDRLALQVAGEEIVTGALRRPLVVVANYLLDSIPHDLFYLDGGECQDCLVSLLVEEDPATLSPAELIARLRFRYDHQALAEPPYDEAPLRDLLADYQRRLSATYLLFPQAGLRCLLRLQALSRAGLVLLSADKGDHRLETLEGSPPPCLVHHGSFSLSVNYHAYKAFCERAGGLALFPDRSARALNVSCLLLVPEAAAHAAARQAYRRFVRDFGPDDLFALHEDAHQQLGGMTLAGILSDLRLSCYDCRQLAEAFPRLLELAPALDGAQRQELVAAVERVWASYFPLGEACDLANQIACLLYEVEDYDRALAYFERSVEIYGPFTGTLYNMALCCRMLEQRARAEALLREILAHDPENREAAELLAL